MKKETKFYATALCDGRTIKKGDKFEILYIRKNIFHIISKITGNTLFCLKENCEHLLGGNWKITEE